MNTTTLSPTDSIRVARQIIANPVTCRECVHYRALYTRQGNGGYKPLDAIAWCSGKEKEVHPIITPGTPGLNACKFFTPINPSGYQQLWVRVPGET